MGVTLSHVDFTLKLNTFDALIRELQLSVRKDDGVAYQCLDHINSHLHNAVLACQAASCCSESSKNTSFPEAENIPATKKPEHQWRFSKTVSKPGRKKHGSVLRHVA